MKKTLIIMAGIVVGIAMTPAAQDANPGVETIDAIDNHFQGDHRHRAFYAQADGPDSSRSPGRMGMERRGPHGMGRHMPERKHLEQFRMLKLMELLDLREDQEVTFLTAFNGLRRHMRELGTERHQILTELADGLRDSSHTETDINKLVADLETNEQQRRAAMDEFLSEARQILTAYQFGKLVIFEERFERQLLERLKEFLIVA